MPCSQGAAEAACVWVDMQFFQHGGLIQQLAMLYCSMIWVLCCACRVPVTTKLDPIIAITCVAHSSVHITAKPSAGGAAPELGDIQALDSQGEEEGMDTGLGGDSPGESRAVVSAYGSLRMA